MPVPAVYPARIPTAAPANSIVPFTRAPSPPAGSPAPLPSIPTSTSPGIAPLRGAAPLPAPTTPPTSSTPAIPLARGLPAVPAAVAAAEAGAGIGLVPALAGAAGLGLLDLLFPRPAAAPEAPGIDPSLSPLQRVPRENVPVTIPGAGIYPSAAYNRTFQLFRKHKPGVPNPDFAYESTSGVLGSNLAANVAAFSASYPANTATHTDFITGLVITPQGTPTGIPTFPDYSPLIPQQAPTQPLQNPVPVDSEGNRRAFAPPPPPVVVPFRRPPSPNPTLPPQAPPDSPVPVPPVIPQTPPDAPPYFPPIPYNPVTPVPIPPTVPDRATPRTPSQTPALLPVAPPREKRLPPLALPPIKNPPETPPPVDEKGFYAPPFAPATPPPTVPATERTRGADCCDVPSGDCEPCDLDEVLEKLRKIIECVCIDDREILEASLGTGTSGVYTLPTDTVYVSVSIPEMPSQVRSQSGNAEGRDIYFVGSYSFGAQDGHGDRKPLSYKDNVYGCPRTCDSFLFQTNFGAIASVKAFYLAPAV